MRLHPRYLLSAYGLRLQQIFHRAAIRKLEIGSDVCQRPDDERALGDAWMRQLQIRSVQSEVVVEQDVHVDRARTPPHAPLPSPRLFDRLDARQQVPGRQPRLDLDGAIEVRGK